MDACPEAGEPSAEPVPGLVGRSRAFVEVVEQIRAFAAGDATVLIEGETGTGKELFARAVHRLGERRDRPFTAVNCGALPRELVENELFGHKRSAFTGAATEQLGLIRSGEGGVLFFDEIDCLPLAAQAKLLRFVEDHEYRPLGGSRVLHADVRLIAACNSDLEKEVEQGCFRRDLFYRFDVLRLRVPPLRDRREDIPLLVSHFLDRFRRRLGCRARRLSSEAAELLLHHDWPGNVRELEHVIERATALGHDEPVLTTRHVRVGGGRERFRPEPFSDAKRRVVEEFERSYLRSYLAAFDGNITRAAAAAKKNRRAFFELMRKHDIDAAGFRR